jgi:hypothetical protein
MSTTFVRESFYVDPPKKNASVEEWSTWLKADNAKAVSAKRSYTRSQSQCDMPDYQGTSFNKTDGVWRQSTTIGVVGDYKSQEVEIEQSKFEHSKRGTSPSNRRGRSEKHRNRRDRRKFRKAANKA